MPGPGNGESAENRRIGFEREGGIEYQYDVRLLRTMLTVLLAVAWMPLTAHCQIEKVVEVEVLSCAPAETGGTCDGSPCDGGSCCAWESGQFHLPQSQPPAAAPLAAVLALVSTVATTQAAAAVDRVLDPSPSDSRRPWQFSLRAALPPRAPSIAS